jgi:hypothetical protein
MDQDITPARDEPRARLADMGIIVALAVVSRALLLLIGHVAAQHAGTSARLQELLCHFDCSWYLLVADHGYSTHEASDQPGATNYGFFPLFPLLIRAAMPLFGNSFYAAVAIANVAFLCGLIYVYRYALLLGTTRTAALLAIAILCFFPQSIAYSVPYSESIFLLLLAAGIYHLLREQFLLAGIAAALLSAARPTGILFTAFVIACAVRAVGWRNLLMPWREPERYVPLLLAPLGQFLFMGYCLLTTGDAFAHSSTELHGWGWRFTVPWHGLGLLLRLHGAPFAAAACSVVVFAFSLLLLKRRRYQEFVLCAAFFLLIWCTPNVGSIFRYWLVLFPIWVEIARRVELRPIVTAAMFSVLAMLNGSMMWAWALSDGSAI